MFNKSVVGFVFMLSFFTGCALSDLGFEINSSPKDPILTGAAVSLALNKAAVASSVEKAGMEAKFAVDGNAATRWSSAFTDPQWFYVDLGTSQTVNKVVLNWETAAGKSYQIQVSPDAINWSAVYATTTGVSGLATITFADVSARYVRMYGTARTTVYGYSLYEFEVYGPNVTSPTNQVPGKIEAESYAAMSGVQTEAAADTGGGLDVGWTDAGDWMDYPVNITTAGSYTVDYRVAAQTTAGVIDFLLDGVKLGTTPLPVTGGWQTWQTVTSSAISLPAGAHTVRLGVNKAGFNLNWFTLNAASPTNTNVIIGKTIPGQIEAETYDSMFGVQTEACSEGGQDVGYIDSGDWVDYSVNVQNAGTYSIEYRVAGINGSGKIELRKGDTVLATTYIPASGGWQIWNTVSALVNLSAGSQTLRIYSIGNGFNLNWIKFTGVASTGSVQVVQTSLSGDRLSAKPGLSFVSEDGSALSAVVINPSQTYQSIVGFGGAFTESVANTLSRVSAAKRNQVLNDYFSPNGANYTLTRTHINSCDFSLGNYSYDDTPGDTALNNFSIQHDRAALIPLIKDAMAVPGAGFQIMASPWSPPAWMKASGQMNGGGALLPQYYGVWAHYLSKYIKAYAQEGIPIEYLTVQNEPENPPVWEGCVYTAAQERDFVKNNLGPRFAADNIQTKIVIFDHNKDHILNWANTILGDAAAAQYVWGTGFHWYSGDQFENVAAVHNQFPSKHLLHTEGCQEGGPHLNEYGPAERYGHDIIGDLNNWAEGWIDWNLALDETGGPNHVGNLCSAPIMANTLNNTIIYNPSYFYMAHFSKYIRPQAVRIASTTDNANIEATAFKNTDGKIVVVVMNRSANAISFKVKNGTQIIKPVIPAHAIMNFIF